MGTFTIDTNNKEFQDALNLIQYTSQSVFLTGKAGTGKSTFLKHICSLTKKKHIVLAPTGVAAINAGGSTIHSFFKMPFRPMLPDDPDLSLNNSRIFNFLKYTKPHKKIISQVELIIIDEISMVRADMIDFIDRVLRVYSGNMRTPFGGKQMLFVGDVFQLEPVVTSDSKEILNHFYPNPYFFSARVFNEISLIPIELQKVYRQADQSFVSILDRIRNNTPIQSDLQSLNNRVNQTYEPSNEEFCITLATRRDNVDYINEKKLAELKSKEYIFKGEIEGDFPDNSLPTSKELVLKEKAQVIFIKNDFERRWVNGTIGVISQITTEGKIIVLLENGTEVNVARDSWRNLRYKFNEKENKIEEEELGSFSQYPIRLAWAITVHKSQGLTFNNVVIDFSGGAFAGGQTYVALSRCTSLEGIVLKKQISRTDVFIRPEIVEFSRHFNNRQLIEQSLKQGKADRLYAEACRLYDKADFEPFMDVFFEAIHARYDLEKPVVNRFLRRKLNIINILNEKNKQLKEQLDSQSANLKDLSHEYYLMGNECILKAKDARAAIANFDKAISLYPVNVDAWIQKGITLMDENEYYESSVCLNRAVELSPRNFKALYNRGKIRMLLKEYDGAVSDFFKAVDIKPKNPTVNDRLGDAFEKTGYKKMAKKYREIAKQIRNKKQ